MKTYQFNYSILNYNNLLEVYEYEFCGLSDLSCLLNFGLL